LERIQFPLFWNIKLGLKRTYRTLTMKTILSTDQDMIPARNPIDALAQLFVVNDVLLLLILKAFTQ
jgi:hypothetical protein